MKVSKSWKRTTLGRDKFYANDRTLLFFTISEIPIWLRVYFKACPTLDHHLKWELFCLPELEHFEAMLTRLFRDELEELVMR